MFEVAELGQSVDKATYKDRLPELRRELLEVQFAIRERPVSVIVVLAGVEGAGKGTTLNTLLEWMDSRGVRAHALSQPDAVEKERPRFWRFWHRQPGYGQIAFYLGSWYTWPIVDRVFDKIDDATFDRELLRIVEFEEMLAAEGTLVVKFWLHIPEERQRENLERLEDDPETAWRVTEQDWEFHSKYQDFRHVCSRVIRRTSTGKNPWHIVEATDSRYRNLTVGETLLETIQKRLGQPDPPPPEPLPLPEPDRVNILNTMDLDKSLDKDAYKKELKSAQHRLGRLARHMKSHGKSLVCVFEGWDAAGKGGCIRRAVFPLDARFYRVIPIAAPTDEEKIRPYLWRFWRHIPRIGHTTIFDRSWYGRVMVERIEGYTQESAWRRAYAEINAFEEQLTENGVVLLKFWLQISPEEQLKRFKKREATGYKRYKLTDEDWRNRDKWGAYEAAVCDVIERTSTDVAPWTLVEANDKRHARVKVVQTMADTLEAALQ